jgi:hypothetical protein
MAKEGYEMPQSDSDVESESGEVDRKSNKLRVIVIMRMMMMMNLMSPRN